MCARISIILEHFEHHLQTFNIFTILHLLQLFLANTHVTYMGMVINGVGVKLRVKYSQAGLDRKWTSKLV